MKLRGERKAQWIIYQVLPARQNNRGTASLGVNFQKASPKTEELWLRPKDNIKSDGLNR